MAKKGNNILALGVGLNLDPLNNDIVAAANTAKDGMDKIGQSVVNAGAKADKPLKETRDKVLSLSAQMRQARLDAQQLALGGKELGEAFQASVVKAASLKDQIAAVDQAIMANSTTIQNVGQPAFQTAKSGYNGMAMSINQLTREMPAFTYSMQTGFMAISNNIPMFVDQINAAKIANQGLAASGQPVQSVFSQVASSLFSWQTLMGVGITILTVYGAKIYEYVSGNKSATAAIKEQEEALKKLNEERAKEVDKIWKPQQEKKKLAESELRLMKDGLQKQLAASQMARTSELDENWKQFKLGERNALDYNKVRNRINQFYINEDLRIKTEFNKKELDKTNEYNNKYKAYLSDLAEYKIKLNKYETEEIGRQNKLAEDKAKLAPKLKAMQKPTMPSLGLSGYDFGKSKNIDLGFNFDLAALEAGMLSASAKLEKINKNMWAKLADIKEQGLNNVFGSIGEALGSTLAKSIKGENTDMFGALRDAMLISIADMAISVGTALVAAGVALAIDPTTSAMTGAYTKIAAGTALIAAGSLAKGLIKSGSSSSSPSGSGSVAQSSFSQGANMNSNFTSNQGNTILINGMIKGNDIQLVNGRNDKKFNRNFNFG